MEMVLIAVLAALALWVYLRQRQGAPLGGLFSGPKQPVRPPPASPRTMPRLGEPGTITEEQFTALNRNLFMPSREWSFEEAALVLDAVTYLRAVCAAAIGVREPDLGVQNELLTFILQDQDLRDYVRKWGENRRAQGIDEPEPELKRNDQFYRVARAARRLTGAA
jgi:hypothetical protein